MNRKQTRQGFTLLEVMIAISILAITFVALLGNQAKSVSLATEANFFLQAPLLASSKIAEYESGIEVLESSSGDFTDEAPGYTWTVEVADFSLDDNDEPQDNSAPKLQKLTITIQLKDTDYSYSTSYYHLDSDGETR